MRNRNRFKRFVAAFFMFIFIGYYGSITLFYHSHIVPGDTITHSHPFKTATNGIPAHSHSEKGYLTIQLLSCLSFSLILFNITFKKVFPLNYEVALKTKQGTINHSFYRLSPLRAPPC